MKTLAQIQSEQRTLQSKMEPLHALRRDLDREHFEAVKVESQNANWISTSEWVPDGVEVLTKIDDGNGVRNVCTLKKQGNLWFVPDGSMYVYYRPTHYANIG